MPLTPSFKTLPQKQTQNEPVCGAVILHNHYWLSCSDTQDLLCFIAAGRQFSFSPEITTERELSFS